MRKPYLSLVCSLLFSLPGYGQQTLRPSIYFQDMNYYNPSAINLDTAQDHGVSLYGKHKFTDNDEEIWNKPTTLMLNYTGRIRESNTFYTVSYIRDRYSFFNRNTVYAGYAHQKKWGRSGIFSVGGRAVLNLDGIHWTRLDLPNNETGKTVKASPDLDLGIQYQVKGFTAGLSAKNILSLSTKLDGSELLKNRRELYLNTSYRFNIWNNFQVAPYLLWYRERKAMIDAGLSLSFFHTVNASYLLRLNELRSIFTLDVKTWEGLHIGLAWDRSRLLPDHNLDFVVRYFF